LSHFSLGLFRGLEEEEEEGKHYYYNYSLIIIIFFFSRWVLCPSSPHQCRHGPINKHKRKKKKKKRKENGHPGNRYRQNKTLGSFLTACQSLFIFIISSIGGAGFFSLLSSEECFIVSEKMEFKFFHD
jgi:hypothetical protein